MHKGKVIGEGIVGVSGSSKTFGSCKNLTQLCAKGWQMVMVTKVFKLIVKLMVVKPSRNPHIMKLDEACVPLAPNNTYVLWASKWLL